MDGFPSGQRGQTVNLLATLSVVRIHLHPFCRSGGTGRRTGLKILRDLYSRTGSIPVCGSKKVLDNVHWICYHITRAKDTIIEYKPRQLSRQSRGLKILVSLVRFRLWAYFIRYAGVVQWQNTSLPSWIRGFDSHHPLFACPKMDTRKKDCASNLFLSIKIIIWREPQLHLL